ncbi:MAG TPA: MarC family protein [Candidatus Avirikenella pullistercoris]|mgnify:CR=1 FL=1|nr:MarC family protein [Candidatus Avirikenella pullistercoris]
MDIKLFFSAFLAFIALVNPVQKIFVVFSLGETHTDAELKRVINKATVTAIGVLLLFLFLGEAILKYAFNLQIYAFQVTCGIVLFYNGFIGLQKGAFLTIDRNTRIEDIIAVPIAIPMIAGPATITAVVTMPAVYGRWTTIIAVILALLLNLVIMRNAGKIGKVLVKQNILMPMIRIIGLIVAAIGVQMVMNGIEAFIKTLPK